MAPIDYLNPDASFKDWIASDLRFYRELKELSLAQMGRIMGCSRHTVSNIEHARDGWNMNEDHATRLDEYLILNRHFGRLVQYARTAHDPDWFAEYARHEAKALIIRSFRLSIMPGLFQTPEYARALICGARAVKDVDAAVQDRMRRHEVLKREDPPLIWALIDEGVLYRPVGGREVMLGQLARLREAIELPNISIRVITQEAGYYIGMDGSFNSLTMPTGDLVFVEAPGGGRLIQGSEEVRRFAVHWDWIGASALPWDASRDLIERAMERFR